jgi:hypothetical protein
MEEDPRVRAFVQVKCRFWTSPLPTVWWARQDLNLQPTDYESAALTRLSYGPGVLG